MLTVDQPHCQLVSMYGRQRIALSQRPQSEKGAFELRLGDIIHHDYYTIISVRQMRKVNADCGSTALPLDFTVSASALSAQTYC